MKHCDACTVDFTGDMARCPLCQNELRGEASPAAFPAQQIYLRPRRLAVEIITFVTGAILLLHGFFSYLFSWPIPIASASAAALIISVLFIYSAILHVPRPLRLMFRYFYIMLAIALVWFVATMNHVGLPAGAARPARLRPPSALLGIRQTVLGLIASCAQAPDLGWKP